MPAAPEAGGAIRRRVRRWSLPAAVTGAAVAFDGRSGAFALGDGSLRRVGFAEDAPLDGVALHAGAVLALAPAPGGGFLTGGDDGRVAL